MKRAVRSDKSGMRRLGEIAILMAAAWNALYGASPHVPGRLLAGIREGAAPAAIEQTLRVHRARLYSAAAAAGMQVIEVAEEDSAAIQSALRATGLFEYVEPDYYAGIGSAPNDPSYPLQWHLARIGAPAAWTLSTGSASAIVAVIDSGVDATHPDLAGKLVPGWNFLQSTSDTDDANGHGTAVAGIVAAATDNAIGVAGVAWNSRVMPLVVTDSQGSARYSDIAAAITYAADRGVRVINISIGGTAASVTLQNAVEYAWKRGALVFAAAMNGGDSTPYYPAACPHAVAVAATDSLDRIAVFSNFGAWTTLAAPGTDILTTMNHGGYGYGNGTSFAAPIAAGVAALVWTVAPQLSADDALAILGDNAEACASYLSGCRRVNAFQALRAAAASARPAVGPEDPPSSDCDGCRPSGAER